MTAKLEINDSDKQVVISHARHVIAALVDEAECAKLGDECGEPGAGRLARLLEEAAVTISALLKISEGFHAGQIQDGTVFIGNIVGKGSHIEWPDVADYKLLQRDWQAEHHSELSTPGSCSAPIVI